MGRYIGSPESLVSEIENIVPTASRFNNRCLYTTPGTYSFTVPSGISSITAVAAGPGGEQCSIMKCLVTCGMMRCLIAGQMITKCLSLEAACNYTCPACSPTLGTCLCAFDVCRCLCVCMQKIQWCMYQCTSGDVGSSNCINCYELSCLGMLNQTQYFTYSPSGAGGGYVEKTANTAPGCVYDVVVGANCCAGGFSCVSGANVSICATGPKLSSGAHISEATQCDVYFHNGSAWVCMLPENIMTSCTLVTCLCTSPSRCFARQCRCGTYGGMCYCIVSSWDLKCSPGCGFGGDINRVGGWCVLDLCNSLTGTANTSYYQYDCHLCTMQNACLSGWLYACTAAAGNICTAFCLMRDCVAPACCTTISDIRSYNFIRTYADNMHCFMNHASPCFATFKDVCTVQNFIYAQNIREVGDSIACVTNFCVNASGTHNPYSTPAAATQHTYDKWVTNLCLHTCTCQSSCWYCSPSGATCNNDQCYKNEFYYDFMCACYCYNPFRLMNCDNVGNVNNRFKFGGSSAGNYFRNGVSGLGDESVYTLTCNRQFGHCGSTPYVACCSFNCGFNNYSSTCCAIACWSRNGGSFSTDGNMFVDMYCFQCISNNGSPCSYAGYGGSSFCCMLCLGQNFGLWAIQKSTGNQYGYAGCDFLCTTYIRASTGLCNSLDTLDVRLPNALTTCLSGFTGFRWKTYNNPHKNIFGNQMLNMFGAEGGMYCRSCHGYTRICHIFCEDSAYGGTGCVLGVCVWPARTTNRYYNVCCALDSCFSAGVGGLLKQIISACGTYSNICDCNCVCIFDCGNGQCRSMFGCAQCYMVACHNYWPNCVGYNFITSSCKVFNMNPTINLYDYWCSSPCLCAVNQVGLQTPFCHMQTFGHNLVYPEKWLTSLYYPGANTVSPCCIYKSTDNIDITDNHYNATYTAGFYICSCSQMYYMACGCDPQSACFRNRATLTRLNTGACLSQTKTFASVSCPLANNQSYAQGGAGIGTAGIWGEGVITCTLVCSGGGNLRCIVPCCNIAMCYVDPPPGQCGTCTFCKALGWGLGPNQVTLSVVDLAGCGQGAQIITQFTGMGCCCGMASTIGGCTGTIPINSLCAGCSHISQVDLLGTGGTNYTACTVICSQIDRYVWTCCTYRNMMGNMFCCWIAYCCNCWIPEAGTFRCSAFVNTDGCARAMGCMCGVSLQPLFCAIVQPAYSCYCCVASVYAEGSGGGSKTGQSYCAKYSSIIDSPTIVSINPARGGRGNESPYEPYYYSYPGISARLSTPKSPTQYVGDTATGCCWFDTPQINGSGGNGMFCSADFSCIYVQEPGPGGGGSNGAKADGTICGLGGVLGGGAGCCGTGGYGGGAGWMGTPGTGMVVIYWNT